MTKLTIGMATCKDFDGVWFTVNALRWYHPEVMARTEIVVVDNGPCARTQDFCTKAGVRYFQMARVKSTAQPRNAVFRVAEGEIVLVLDCHVLVAPGALARLLAYCENEKNSKNLLQGPMVYDTMDAGVATHFEPVWRAEMYGVWGHDPRGADPAAPPFEIPMQGLGLFACRKDAWLWFNHEHQGFGGEEGYIHEKFRQAGHTTLCLPFLRWLHRTGAPGTGRGYTMTIRQKFINYLVGWIELGLNVYPVVEHFAGYLGKAALDDAFFFVTGTRLRQWLHDSGLPMLNGFS